MMFFLTGPHRSVRIRAWARGGFPPSTAHNHHKFSPLLKNRFIASLFIVFCLTLDTTIKESFHCNPFFALYLILDTLYQGKETL